MKLDIIPLDLREHPWQVEWKFSQYNGMKIPIILLKVVCTSMLSQVPG